MGMGHGANWADTISNENLDELTGGLVSKLTKYLEDNGETLDSLAADIRYDGGELEEEIYDTAVEMVGEINRTFQKQLPSLILTLDYHDPDGGDRYDDVSGSFWIVMGMRVLSEDGKKIADKVTTAAWVTFG